MHVYHNRVIKIFLHPRTHVRLVHSLVPIILFCLLNAPWRQRLGRVKYVHAADPCFAVHVQHTLGVIYIFAHTRTHTHTSTRAYISKRDAVDNPHRRQNQAREITYAAGRDFPRSSPCARSRAQQRGLFQSAAILPVPRQISDRD